MSYVALKGGPLDGWWYTMRDWTVCRQAAVNMNRHPGQPQGYVLGYQESGREIANPRPTKVHAIAAVWVWRPQNTPPSAQNGP
jgi:hypothetical protein